MRSYFSYLHIGFVILWLVYIFCRHKFGRDPNELEDENSTDERQQAENNENHKRKISQFLKEAAYVSKKQILMPSFSNR